MELEWGTEDDEYLDKVERNIEKSLQEHLPDVVVYNAGTDILEGDRLGGLSISPAVRPDSGDCGRVCSVDSAAAGKVVGLMSGRRWAEATAVWSRAGPAEGLPDTMGVWPA